MKLVTWNVNSIQTRLKRLLNFINREEPELICLQELKCLEEKFPFSELEALGYKCAVSGQKAYNGVALLSRLDLNEVSKGFGNQDLDQDARLIAAKVGSFYIINVYVPNGQEIGSEKYAYKLKWLESLEDFLKIKLKTHEKIIICGDFNIAPKDQDVYDPKSLKESILFSSKEHKALSKIFNLGFCDLLRSLHPKQKIFSWWDYRKSAFLQNHGLRIDLILGTEPVLEQLEDVYVDTNERKGGQASDHAPVVSIFKTLRKTKYPRNPS